mgnify:FL=1
MFEMMKGIISQFLLTRPLRGVTQEEAARKAEEEFLLTRPLRGVTRENNDKLFETFISTHTPLARRDQTNTNL